MVSYSIQSDELSDDLECNVASTESFFQARHKLMPQPTNNLGALRPGPCQCVAHGRVPCIKGGSQVLPIEESRGCVSSPGFHRHRPEAEWSPWQPQAHLRHRMCHSANGQIRAWSLWRRCKSWRQHTMRGQHKTVIHQLMDQVSDVADEDDRLSEEGGPNPVSER